MKLIFGILQGSLLGPLLFIMYNTPLVPSYAKLRISNITYTQMTDKYTIPSTHPVLIILYTNSLVSVQDLMYENRLKLNHDKMEFLLIRNKLHRKDFLPSFPIDILGNNISPTPSARNLGIIFDEDFSFVHYINSIAKSCHYHMCEFRQIHKHLNRDTAISVTNAIVGSIID